jgi:hypothetical protein
MAIGWLDVPTDPTVTVLAAHTVFYAYPAPSVSHVFSGPAGGVFVEYDNANPLDPAVLLTAPLSEPGAVSFVPSLGLPAMSAYAGASGNRLVTYRFDPMMNQAWFSLEIGAGVSGAHNTVSDVAFATGIDGSFLYSATTYDAANMGYPLVRLAWVLNDGMTSAFDATQHVDLESYAPEAMSLPLAGPIAWIDAKSALALAGAAEDTTKTSVQVAIRSPPGLSPMHRKVLPKRVDSLAAAASNGFGYVLSNDSPTASTLHVFAPSCPESDN